MKLTQCLALRNINLILIRHLIVLYNNNLTYFWRIKKLPYLHVIILGVF